MILGIDKGQLIRTTAGRHVHISTIEVTFSTQRDTAILRFKYFDNENKIVIPATKEARRILLPLKLGKTLNSYLKNATKHLTQHLGVDVTLLSKH